MNDAMPRDGHGPPAGAVFGRTKGGIAFDDRGSGPPIVLIHAGVADRRMWEPQLEAFAASHRVIRYDVRGFGESMPPDGSWSQHGDLLALLDELLIGRAHLIGVSIGAGIAVEAALARPSAVASMTLAAPGGALYGAPPSELRAVWAAEVEALDRGDLNAAVEVNLRTWVDGPSRGPEDVDQGVRAKVARMQREAFELPEWDQAAAPEHELSPPASARLKEIACPVLVVVGSGDQPATIAAAERLAAETPGTRFVVWPDVAHMLTMERPGSFAELVLAFLDDVESRERRGTLAASTAARETD